MYNNRTLIRGDNLEEMRKFSTESVDLIATDPPFNSKRDYFVPYRDEQGQEPDSLVKAFTDTWAWGDAAEEACRHLIVEEGRQIGATIHGLQQFLNQTPMMAYLVMMAVRIVEMHRLLKNTGSLYLHCDSTASHYLKIILDAIFDTKNFRNEIVWKRRLDTHNLSTFHLGRNHDIIFYYGKSPQASYRIQYTPYDSDYIKSAYKHEDAKGRYRLLPCTNESGGNKPYSFRGVTRAWRFSEENMNRMYKSDLLVQLRENGPYYYKKYLSEAKGVPLQDIWTDIAPARGKASIGYPTQKPLALYERIIKASSNKGELVLDPFCGCGTTLMAAETQGRQWIGIDLTYLATGAVKLQIEKFFPQLRDNITTSGTPEDATTALALARTDSRGFEEWCVTHVLKFKSNAKKVADGGIDGTLTFPIGKVKGRQAYSKMAAQVKGGNYTVSQVRDFRTAMQNAKADLGVFVVTRKPTRGMLDEVRRAGTYQIDAGGFTVSIPCLQIYQIQDYFKGILPKMPFGERQVL